MLRHQKQTRANRARHKNGIAVILDVVYNHSYRKCATGKIDDTGMPPTAGLLPIIPGWTSRHRTRTVCSTTFNHNRPLTQNLAQIANFTDLHEYKVDGFRFDLGKGFTQTVPISPRWKTMMPAVQPTWNVIMTPIVQSTASAMPLLNSLTTDRRTGICSLAVLRFGVISKLLLTIRSASMGYTASADITPMVYSSAARALPNPGDRLQRKAVTMNVSMYKNLLFGNVSTAGHNVKTTGNCIAALWRSGCRTYSLIPGPKMCYGSSRFVAWQAQSVMPRRERLANQTTLYGITWMTLHVKALYDAYSTTIKFRLANPSYFLHNTVLTAMILTAGWQNITSDRSATNGLCEATIVSNMDVTAQTKTPLRSAGQC